MRRAATAAVACACAVACLGAQEPPSWPDTFDARVQALALVQTLNAEILSSRSATAALERWCADHRLADPPVVVASRMRDRDRPITLEQRRRLRVSDRETIAYRHVRLSCGARVLSEADNWYVPRRLTAAMNRQLHDSDTPFGRVVQPLEPYRQTLAATLLWSPLPAGWENAWSALPPASGALEIPNALFEHRAILYTRNHVPFAEVDEMYQREILAFSPRR